MVHAARASQSRATAPPLPPSTRHFLIAGEKILKTELTPSVPSPNAFPIAGDLLPFSPAAPRISNRYTKLLEIELTSSQQTRKYFLIAIICPTFFSPVPLRAILIGTPRRLEIDLTHSQQTRKDFLIGTICPIFFFVRAAPHPSLVTDHSSPPHLISIRYEWNPQNRRSVENKGETTFYSIQICPSWHRQSCLCALHHV